MSVAELLLGRPVVRRLVDRLVNTYARRRARQLDQLDAPRVQQQTLLRLVRFAQHTRFGRDHDFARIRSVADFQARVPLRDYEVFWSDYWREPFPCVEGVTWPEYIPYFGLSSGTTSGTTKYIPLSRRILASNKKAALTTLAWFLDAHPGTPLFTGRLFFLGGSTDLVDLSATHRTNPLTPDPSRGTALPSRPRPVWTARESRPTRGRGEQGRVLGGDLSGITSLEASSWMGPFSFPPVELALVKDWEQKMTTLARTAAGLNITMLSGVPSWMLLLFERLRQATGKEHISDIWPGLRLVIHGGTKFDPYRDLFRQQIGSDAVHFTEVYPASEAYIAAQDHRHGLLRLIPDHDVFFEFVPVENLESARPARHTLDCLELGVNYAVVLSTCAGLWSYVLGDTVIFERRSPPLLRFSGRTRYFLSAFGEHLISEEVERAVAEAARATSCAVVDFHVGPVFPEDSAKPGRHRYLVEFAGPAPELATFTARLDEVLCRLNEDYQAHRQGDLTMLPPEIVPVPPGGFADWMRSKGKLGGQHKVPRMDNSGAVTAELTRFFSRR
jgi:hypothetical protein